MTGEAEALAGLPERAPDMSYDVRRGAAAQARRQYRQGYASGWRQLHNPVTATTTARPMLRLVK